MIDKDLAKLYGVEPKRLNEQVRRNKERFPDDFMFQLTADECSRSQFATLNIKRGQNVKYLPYAFTEQGIAMLSGVLKSTTAVAVNIRIMRAFVAMKRFVSTGAEVVERFETIEYHQLEMQYHQNITDKRIEEIFQLMERNNEIPPRGVFYDGQIFDAHSFVCELIRKAEQRVVLVDNYIDDTILKRLDKRKEGVSATIYTRRVSAALQTDINIHNAQYPVINIEITEKVHDRFLIIDDIVYHIGASIKDLGKKVFAFSKMGEPPEELLRRIC